MTVFLNFFFFFLKLSWFFVCCQEDSLFYSKWMQSVTFKGYNVSDTKWAFPPMFIQLLGRLLPRVIAVDLVLLRYICTKMDYMLLMLAVRILHSRALVHKVTGQDFWLVFKGLTVRGVQSQNNHIQVFKKREYFTRHSALNKELFIPSFVILN